MRPDVDKVIVSPRATPSIALPDGCRKRGQWLEHLIKVHGWSCGAELGVWRGETFTHLLANCAGLSCLYGVDLWASQPDNDGPESYVDWPHDENERRVRAVAARHGDRGRVLKMWTHEAARLVPDESLDFVYIDADHSEQGVRRDIADWLPKVKATGWILGHDINWDTVRRAVDDLLPGYVIGPDNAWGRPKSEVAAGIAAYLAVRDVPVSRRHKTLVQRLRQWLRLNKLRDAQPRPGGVA